MGCASVKSIMLSKDNIYLVGGAVRDQLLKRPVKEKDWVVVGETQASMLAMGFQQVGKDFPVFLHPQTKEEYALARKERKIAKGYHGFEFDTTASVTLQEDLLRRDLTINAIAQDNAGRIIDPYHGTDDLKNKILRHVSPAFVEDPVRILRVARFAARFPEFVVADETNNLMKKMAEDGEVDALVSERVWKEFEKAMSECAPWRFIEVLSDCNALPILFSIFNNKKTEVILCLKKISEATVDVFERVVLMMAATNSLEAIKSLCQHYRAPKAIFEMITLFMNYLNDYLVINKKSSIELLELFISLDAFRREERFKQWLKLCEIKTVSTEPSVYLLMAFNLIKKIELPKEVMEKYTGESMAAYIFQRRLERLNQIH